MAYQELIKNFERIRDYMRQFYVFGFKSREEYDAKSARSYDDERRRSQGRPGCLHWHLCDEPLHRNQRSWRDCWHLCDRLPGRHSA